MSNYRSWLGKPRRSPYWRNHFWRPQTFWCSFSLSIAQLASRRLCWRYGELWNDFSRWNNGNGCGSRSVFIAAVPQLQRRSLHWTLVGNGETRKENAKDFSCQLVPSWLWSIYNQLLDLIKLNVILTILWQGKFLWPGYGENIRVLDWILRRCEGQEGNAKMSIVGNIPTEGQLIYFDFEKIIEI